MGKKTSFERALRKMPKYYRKPLREYLENGVLPADKALLAILAGQYRVLIEHHDEFGHVLKFLDNFCPPFAHGSALAVANWEYMQSTIGTRPEYVGAA